MALSAFAWPLRTVLRHQADSFGGSDDVGSFCKTSDRTVVLYGYGICWVASFLSYLFIDMDAVVEGLIRPVPLVVFIRNTGNHE